MFSCSENDSTDTQCGCFFVNSMFLHQFVCPRVNKSNALWTGELDWQHAILYVRGLHH